MGIGTAPGCFSAACAGIGTAPGCFSAACTGGLSGNGDPAASTAMAAASTAAVAAPSALCPNMVSGGLGAAGGVRGCACGSGTAPMEALSSTAGGATSSEPPSGSSFVYPWHAQVLGDLPDEGKTVEHDPSRTPSQPLRHATLSPALGQMEMQMAKSREAYEGEARLAEHVLRRSSELGSGIAARSGAGAAPAAPCTRPSSPKACQTPGRSTLSSAAVLAPPGMEAAQAPEGKDGSSGAPALPQNPAALLPGTPGAAVGAFDMGWREASSSMTPVAPKADWDSFASRYTPASVSRPWSMPRRSGAWSMDGPPGMGSSWSEASSLAAPGVTPGHTFAGCRGAGRSISRGRGNAGGGSPGSEGPGGPGAPGGQRGLGVLGSPAGAAADIGRGGGDGRCRSGSPCGIGFSAGGCAGGRSFSAGGCSSNRCGHRVGSGLADDGGFGFAATPAAAMHRCNQVGYSGGAPNSSFVGASTAASDGGFVTVPMSADSSWGQAGFSCAGDDGGARFATGDYDVEADLADIRRRVYQASFAAKLKDIGGNTWHGGHIT